MAPHTPHIGTLYAMTHSEPGLPGARDDEARTVLESILALPDLLSLARDAGTSDRYAAQKKLRQEYLARHTPFVTSKPFRHRNQCSTAEHTVGAAQLTVVDAAAEYASGSSPPQVTVWNYELHEMAVHGARLPEELLRLGKGLGAPGEIRSPHARPPSTPPPRPSSPTTSK